MARSDGDADRTRSRAVPDPPKAGRDAASEAPQASSEDERGQAPRELPPVMPGSPAANGNGVANARDEAAATPKPSERPAEREAKTSERPEPKAEAKARSGPPAVANVVELPSIPPPPVAGPWRSYKELVANLSGRIVEAQRPIRVLNSLKWDPSVFEKFRASRYRENPAINADWYASIDLGFDPKQKVVEFEEIVRDVEKDLSPHDEIAQILVATALQYRDVVRMLESRGTPTFYGYARKLYGSPKDKYPDGKTTVRDSAHALYGILTNLQDELGSPTVRDITAPKAVDILNARLTAYFGESTVRVAEDDGIFADAAAGSDYVKIRRGAMFSLRDIDLFEVHEGWVHLATSLNGQNQPVAKWLGKGPPRTTAAQEGLAALMEIFTFRTYPRRARRLNDRVLAVDKAEDGADFVQIFEWYRTEGYEEEDCFNATRRIFRGGTVTGGAPFTKDICYSKGIVLNYAFIRAAIEHDRPELIPFLFVGKIAHEDIPILFTRASDGVVKPPIYLPPTFRDLNGLAIWMAYSTFFTRLGGEAISDYYGKLFARAG